MRKYLMLAVVIVFSFVGMAMAVNYDDNLKIVNTATMGDQNSSGLYRVYTDNTGTFTFGTDTSIKYPYQTYTFTGAPAVRGAGIKLLVTSDSGSTILDTMQKTLSLLTSPTLTGGGAKYVLPPAGDATTLGTRFTITTAAQGYITLDTYSTSDVILYSISGTGLDAGDSLKSAGQAGDSITVQCNSANTWTVINVKGSFTDNGTS